MRTQKGMDMDTGESAPHNGESLNSSAIENLHPSESGIRIEPTQRMMIVLSADELAVAISEAHKVKQDPSDFALKSAKLILDILPPLYYEPRK